MSDDAKFKRRDPVRSPRNDADLEIIAGFVFLATILFSAAAMWWFA